MPANRSSPRDTPSRPAIASRWMNSLVEPPVAANTQRALSKAFWVITSSGRVPARASSTARTPVRSARSLRRDSTAGTTAEPGKAMPRTSAAIAMVVAVPMTLQTPTVGAKTPSSSSHSSSSIRPMMRSGPSVQTSEVTTGRPWN